LPILYVYVFSKMRLDSGKKDKKEDSKTKTRNSSRNSRTLRNKKLL